MAPMDEKEALKLYEDGKHRRYTLLFSVNGGAFAIAKLINEAKSNIGGLSLKQLSVGMALFTAVMVWDIFEFGRRSRKEPIPKVFSGVGRAVLIIIGSLICIGWLLVGFGGNQ